jgi:hypothetical protein
MATTTGLDINESFYSKHSDSIRMMLGFVGATAVTASVVHYTGLIVALAPLSATMGLLGPVALGLICLTSVAILSKAFEMLTKVIQHKVEADIDNSKSPADNYIQVTEPVNASLTVGPSFKR